MNESNNQSNNQSINLSVSYFAHKREHRLKIKSQFEPRKRPTANQYIMQPSIESIIQSDQQPTSQLISKPASELWLTD